MSPQPTYLPQLNLMDKWYAYLYFLYLLAKQVLCMAWALGTVSITYYGRFQGNKLRRLKARYGFHASVRHMLQPTGHQSGLCYMNSNKSFIVCLTYSFAWLTTITQPV